MRIFDISQEVFSSCVFPGDPAPKKESLCSLSAGDICNLTTFSMCAHNGTHIDAPCHFIEGGKAVDSLPLETLVGYAYVAEHRGTVSAACAREILERAKKASPESKKRILIKGDATVSEEAAEVFAGEGILLIGNESQTVGPEDKPMAVHKTLLGAGVVLLEGIRLGMACEGVYFLVCAPLNLAGSDGSPCRAMLLCE